MILRSLLRSVRARSYAIAGVTHRNLLQSNHQAARSLFYLSSHRSSFSDSPQRVSSGTPSNQLLLLLFFFYIDLNLY